MSDKLLDQLIDDMEDVAGQMTMEHWCRGEMIIGDWKGQGRPFDPEGGWMACWRGHMRLVTLEGDDDESPRADAMEDAIACYAMKNIRQFPGVAEWMDNFLKRYNTPPSDSLIVEHLNDMACYSSVKALHQRVLADLKTRRQVQRIVESAEAWAAMEDGHGGATLEQATAAKRPEPAGA